MNVRPHLFMLYSVWNCYEKCAAEKRGEVVAGQAFVVISGFGYPLLNNIPGFSLERNEEIRRETNLL